MRKLSFFFTLMAAIAIWNLTSCEGRPSASGSASEVNTDSTEEMLEQERAEQKRLEQENAELQRQLEQEKAEQERLEQEKAKQQSYIGTFEIDDGHLGPIVLTVNDDETATIKYKNGDTIYYGSWYKYDTMKYVQFHFEGEEIYVGRKAIPQLYIGGTSKFLGNFVLLDGYLYTSSSAAKAKNPNERLEYKKVS